jgi:hypothetical protein
MWKYIARSRVGTSHQESGQPCQDSHAVRNFPEISGDPLVFVCSDGAGSASHSEIGSLLVCDRFCQLASDYLASVGTPLRPLDLEQAKLWVKAIRSDLEEKADELAIESRQLACTILAGIVQEESAIFLQIGDGAIVVRHEEILSPVFWPQSGEYVNTTNFLTDSESECRLEFKILGRVDELAIFTDGLERLLLRFDTKSVHEPAVLPMLKYLAEATNEQLPLIGDQLADFLESPLVNSRTDDDKTLILAIRTFSDASIL